MFQVRATVVGFLGNTTVYPCHFRSQVGDEVVFDGECLHGRFCSGVWALVVPKMMAMHSAGPRYVDPGAYFPFWYAANSAPDPSQEPCTGLGYRNVLKTIIPPAHDMATLQPPGSFTWPPSQQAVVAREPTVICPDTRTSMVIRLEAFDLSDKGYDAPYFRRQMAILAKLQRYGPVRAEAILGLFTEREIEDIYPVLSPVMVGVLTEELELLNYVRTAELIGVTAAGEARLARFLEDLPDDHRRAFAEYT